MLTSLMENLAPKVATVLEVGFGNLPSLQRVLKQINTDIQIASKETDILSAEYLIIPGVGSFKTAMNYLVTNNFVPAIRSRCLDRKMPTLGICLGAQVMLDVGYEGGINSGIGIFEGTVESLNVNSGTEATHTGWDKTKLVKEFLGYQENTEVDFFFNHDYILMAKDPRDVCGTCSFGNDFAVALNKFKTFAVQFHPEKSQVFGLKMLKNFLEI
jgi:glutamine amidotransferase